MKLMWMIIFFVLPFIGLGYVMWHIWHILPFTDFWRWTTLGIGMILFLTMFIVFSGSLEKMPLNTAMVVYEVGTSAIFILLYLVMIFLLLDLAMIAHVVPKSWLHNNGYTSMAIFLAMLAIFVYGNIHYKDKTRSEITIKTAKHISANHKSKRIILISDLHLGYHNRRQEFHRWVDIINAEKPDLILIAGDIVDISVRPLIEEHVADEFHRLKAPVYACLGNHEYYSGGPLVQQFYKEAGIQLLCDSVARIDGLYIIGRDDRTNQNRKPLKQIIYKAKVNTDSDFTIQLDHQPYKLEEAEQSNIDFQFSGHTHHGQIWPISWITDAIYEDAYGPLRKGHTHYYVSSGIGIWGGKYRIGTQSEYVLLTIKQQ